MWNTGSSVQGLETLEIAASHGCLGFFCGGDGFVPVESIDVLSRYGRLRPTRSRKLGGADGKPGGSGQETPADMADQLIAVAPNANQQIRSDRAAGKHLSGVRRQVPLYGDG